MDTGGRPLQILEKVRVHYPIGLHGVSLSVGSTDPLNKNYLKKLKTLCDRIDPAIISDHLCWTGVGGKNLHDLLPLPFTEEALKHIVKRITQVQEFLGKRILIENVSSYITYKHSHMPEWEFLANISKKSGCGILLDINNIYVNAVNHKLDAHEYINSIPVECVGQFHLAGHTNKGDFLFDTHNSPVIEKVWALYHLAVQRFGQVTTLVEWDADIPEFPVLLKEVSRARRESFLEGRQATRAARTHSSLTPRALVPSEFSSQGKTSVPKRNDSRRAQHEAPKLVSIQNWIKESVLPNARKTNLNILSKSLNPQGGQPGKNRLSVYADGYTARMHESLLESYPAVQHILGEQSFIQNAFKYAEVHPSKDYNLSLAGKYFSDFLLKVPLSKNLPFLPDLAKLEWQIAESFHEFQKKPMALEGLSKLSPEDWEELSFNFQPAVRLLSSRWPVLDIWNARKTPLNKINIDLINRPQHILIYKNDTQVLCELIDKYQFSLLKGLSAGTTLGKVFEKISIQSEAGSLPITQWFSDWAAKGLITNYGIKKSSGHPNRLSSVQA